MLLRQKPMYIVLDIHRHNERTMTDTEYSATPWLPDNAMIYKDVSADS